VDKATGQPRRPVGAAQLLAAVREKKRVELPAASLLLPGPLAALGEHAVPLRFDGAHIRGAHALTVLLKKRL
jgi:hypothetical protein